MIRGSRIDRADVGHGARWGIGLFIEDGAYTTVAAAVTILVVLALVFSAATAAWSMSRAGDTQLAADAVALSGANVVASYTTAATVVDASVLSLGLAGFAVTGAGLVGLLVPGVNVAASKTVEAGLRMIRLRNEFAGSASRGLRALERALPYLIAANGARVCAAQGTGRTSYSGTALAVPRASASAFPALEGADIDTGRLEASSSVLDDAAHDLAAAAEDTARAKEAAWLADCGRDGYSMQERAARLAGLPAASNPDFASSITWEPAIGLARARAYYRARLASEAPENESVEAQADSAARKAFYGFAIRELDRATIGEWDGRLVSTVPLLPKNTAEVRGSSLYTDAVWPSSIEAAGSTLHFSSSCPGAAGTTGPAFALAAIEAGSARECPVCRFGVGDVGRVPAASTSIDNGFEYHLREFTLALDAYVGCRNRELELEERARTEADAASDAFEEALSRLSTARPRIAPPGRYGCVALVVSGETSSPDELDSAFNARASLSRRGAISAAVLAPDAATGENNVLSRFFSTLEERAGGGGVPGLLNDVMGLWGKLLISYGDVHEGLSGISERLLEGLAPFGLGPIATWIGERVDGAVSALDIAPVDLSLKKPVLTDSANVLARSDVPALVRAQDLLRSIPLGTADPGAIVQAIGYEIESYIDEAVFTLAEIPLPGGGSIPLTIRLRDVATALGGGS